jgi:hypothetical protein
MALANGVEKARDLIEAGITPIHARALYKLIDDWKSNGLPAALLSKLIATEVRLCY